jgi:hypothetical protein
MSPKNEVGAPFFKGKPNRRRSWRVSSSGIFR